MSRGAKTKLLWQDPEYRKRMSEAHKGNPSPRKGKKLSREECLKRRRMFAGEIRQLRQNGYIYVHAPDHPRRINGRIPEHTFLMEKCIGRMLTKNEVVHHANGIKTDNRIENLVLMDRKDHFKLHAKERGFGTKIQLNPLRDNKTGRFVSEDVLASR